MFAHHWIMQSAQPIDANAKDSRKESGSLCSGNCNPTVDLKSLHSCKYFRRISEFQVVWAISSTQNTVFRGTGRIYTLILRFIFSCRMNSEKELSCEFLDRRLALWERKNRFRFSGRARNPFPAPHYFSWSPVNSWKPSKSLTIDAFRKSEIRHANWL